MSLDLRSFGTSLVIAINSLIKLISRKGVVQRNMSKKPPVDELQFLKLSSNHNELTRKLATLHCASPDIFLYAQYVCEAWFRLGEQHLVEAKLLLSVRCERAARSRAYYAAYNSSKSARYIIQGKVSLKGDDHASASSDLPGDFPNVAIWALKISELYENRLRADYDNWSTTAADFTLSPLDSVAFAEAFIQEVRTYLNTKFGMKL